MNKRVQGWGQLLYGQQHPVPAQGVEGIHTSGMDCCYHTSFDTKPKLLWCQEGSQLLLYFARSNLSNKAAQGTTQCDGTNPTIFLVWAVRLALKKNGRMDSVVLPSSTGCTKDARVDSRN